MVNERGRRVKAIKELLTRSGAKLDDWVTRGLVGSLRIPMAWINEAKVRCLSCHGSVLGRYRLRGRRARPSTHWIAGKCMMPTSFTSKLSRTMRHITSPSSEGQPWQFMVLGMVALLRIQAPRTNE